MRNIFPHNNVAAKYNCSQIIGIVNDRKHADG